MSAPENRAPDADLAGQRRAYEAWAPIYDRVYTRLLRPAQRAVAAAAAACGPDVLEVGVGTGLVLPYYPPARRVTGIDLSEPMLARAAAKAAALPAVRGLAAMDACRLGFRDGAFDAVAVPFVITLVPDPEGALDEMARVLRPGGEIVVASRFGAEGGPQARFEEAIAPLVKRVGWSSSFKVSRLDAWAKRSGAAELIGVRHGAYFKVVRLRRR